MAKISILIIILLLIGCSSNPIVESKIQYVNKPILYCPEPPTVEKPILLIDNLSENDKNNPGLVAKTYKATIKQLTNYIEQLELILGQYIKTSKDYQELKEKLDEEFINNIKATQ